MISDKNLRDIQKYPYRETSFDRIEEIRKLRDDMQRQKDEIAKLTLENIRLNFSMAHQNQISKPPIKHLDLPSDQDCIQNLPAMDTKLEKALTE